MTTSTLPGTPIVIRPAAGKRGGYTVSIGVHGWTRNLAGRHATPEDAEAAARDWLLEHGETPGKAAIIESGKNAGDELRRRAVDSRLAELGTRLPSLFGYVLVVKVSWAARSALRILSTPRAERSYVSEIDAVLSCEQEQLGTYRRDLLRSELRAGGVFVSLSETGRQLLEAVASVPASAWHDPGRASRTVHVALCGNTHLRSDVPVHCVHNDCSWCGGVAWAVEGRPEADRPRVCGVSDCRMTGCPAP